MIFGQLTPQPADPDFRLPSRRRVLWEFGQDLAIYLSFSVLLNVLLSAVAVLMAVGLILIYQRPPVVLTEEQGYVYWRTTEQFKLRSSMVQTYVQMVTGTLLSIQPGAYDLSGLVASVDPRVLKVFGDALGLQAEESLRANRRQLWKVLEIKRFFDPKLPKYLTLAVRGERAIFEEKKSELGAADLRTTSQVLLYLIYLQQEIPTPDNPWGLRTVGLREVSDTAEAERVWTASFDLTQTVDQQGRSILPPRAGPGPAS